MCTSHMTFDIGNSVPERMTDYCTGEVQWQELKQHGTWKV